MTPALEVHGLWKSYVAGVRGCSARVSVLRGVNFSVAIGERVGVVGGPGAGKTTLLHCISGLRRPDTGFVRLMHHPGVPMLLLDDGEAMDARMSRLPPLAMLLFGRDFERLVTQVDRMLLLRGGRVVVVQSGHGTPRRRVAEPGVCDTTAAFALR